MAYGEIKVDTITFTDGGIDKSVTISGLVQNPTFSGNITVTGTISGNLVRGQTVSGVTVTGTTAQFTSGTFTSITGGTATITSGVFASGTAAAPTITFTGDPDTGIYSPGADQLALSTNGTGRLFINSSGRVGIGTTSPASNLEVRANSPVFEIGQSGATNGGTIAWNNSAGTFDFNTVGTSSWPIVFKQNSTERARIDSSGRLLVGSSSAELVQHYKQNGGNYGSFQVITVGNGLNTPSFVNYGANANGPQLSIVKSRGTAAGDYSIVSNGDNLGSVYFFGSDGTDLRTAGAAVIAQVDGTPGADSMPGRIVLSTTADGASSPTERMRINSNGDVLFSTDTIASITTAATNANAWSETNAAKISARTITTAANHYIFYNPNGNVGSIQTNGSATSYSTSSDYRLKENITPVTDGITRLQQLKPSRFNFIADPTKTVDGFLAHEVQTIIPEAITGEKDAVDEDGNPQYQGIDQSKMVPLVVAALQECIKKVEALEAEVAGLKAGA